MFAAGDEAFGDGLQFLPASANCFGFAVGDLVVGSGGGDDGEQISEFLHNRICGRN